MIEELKRLLLVAKEGNVTKAAERVFITQSALTQSIHRLENELQTKLFQQNGKQLHLTEDGKSVILLAEKITKLWANAHDPKIRNSQNQTYSIGMFDNVALRLGKFIHSSRQTEKYNLELTIDSSSKLLRQLELGTLDGALCILRKTYKVPNHLTLLKTYEETLLPVSSRSFSSDIEKIPFILYNRGSHTRGQIDALFMKHKIQPTIYAESTSVTFMRELALLGAGVALLPANFVKRDLDQGSLKKITMQVNWERTYGLLVQKQYNLQTQFVSDLQSALKKVT